LIRKTADKRKIARMYFGRKWLVIVSFIDVLLSFIWLPKRLFRCNLDSLEYKKILILESHLIGDVIAGLPAYKAIRKRFPNSELIFWGNKWGKEILYDQKIFDKFYINRIPWSVYNYSFINIKSLFSQVKQLRNLNIDLALDFRGDIRNIFLIYLIKAKKRISYDFTGGSYWLTDIISPPKSYHIIDRNLKVAKSLGAEIKHTIPRLVIPKEKIKAAQEYFDMKGLKKIAFLHPGASQPKRLWMPERFAQIVDYLHNKDYSPVLLAGPNDKAIIESIRNKCKGSTDVLSIPLSNIAAYLACGEFFVGLDSGIGHIAASVGIDVIILFGPQPPSIACPRGRGKIVKIMKADFDCRPCHKQVCNFNNACMKAIAVEDVMEAIDNIKRNVVFQ